MLNHQSLHRNTIKLEIVKTHLTYFMLLSAYLHPPLRIIYEWISGILSRIAHIEKKHCSIIIVKLSLAMTQITYGIAISFD